MSAIGMDLADAERMWRQATEAEDRLDMVERALAARHRRAGWDTDLKTPGHDRDSGRTK